jgi:antibiotic biosynthesis monooxygenase (ABM) superfamily enzyme
MATSENQAAFEYVFAQEVRPSKVDRYYALSDKLHSLASQQPGFIHQERRLVETGSMVLRFETILKFDSAEHCIDWLDNPQRRRLLNLEEEEAGFAFQGHGNWDGYSRWLSKRITTEPPKWKVNLLVLLTLYPTAMLLTPVMHAVFKGFSSPSVMLISNALCVAATSWVLVPFASRFYQRWLEGQLNGWRGALAMGSLLLLLALLLCLFEWLPASMWG